MNPHHAPLAQDPEDPKTDGTLRLVSGFIGRHAMLRPGGSVVVGLSGGVDSVALLHMLRRLGYRCTAAHCNFHLRGEESDRDARFVADLCAGWGVPLLQTGFDTRHEALRSAQSIEMAARSLRYDWFETIRRQTGSQAVATAHHLDDQAETFILNLMRQAGLRGLTGMPACRDHIVRPLLCLTRAQIEDYAARHALSHITDSTNLTDQYARNHVRHNVISSLSALNPQAARAINRTQDHLAGYLRIVDQAVSRLRAEAFRQEGGILRILAGPILGSPDPPTVLHELISPMGFNADQCARILTALAGQLPGRRFSSPTHTAMTDRGSLTVSPAGRPAPLPRFSLTTLPADGFMDPLTGRPDASLLRPTATTAYFDARTLGDDLVLRRWRPGDSLIPYGMRGSKKVSDLLRERRIPGLLKPDALVLTASGRVAWVVGVRTAAPFSISGGTRAVARIDILTGQADDCDGPCAGAQTGAAPR